MLAFDSTLSHFLTASQIDETHFILDHSVSIEAGLINKEYGMASGRAVITVSSGNFPILIAEVNEIHNLMMIFYFDLN